jgi:hypothetical protein
MYYFHPETKIYAFQYFYLPVGFIMLFNIWVFDLPPKNWSRCYVRIVKENIQKEAGYRVL